MRNRQKKSAFTLAEVLITLGIIGVVAAMTLPALKQKLEDQRNLSTLKKTYSILQQATNLAIAEHEGPEYWGMVDNSVESVTNVYNYYRPYFNMMRECPNKPGCWGYPTKYLNGTVYWNEHNTSWYQYAFTLVDGVNVLIDIYPADQIQSNFGINVNYDCAVFFIDINADKLPNQIGRDMFAFVVTERGLQPAGLNNYDNCNLNDTGFQCVSRIIKDGWSMKYLKG